MPRTDVPNARFWVFVNCGWVKLTLRPMERVQWHTARRTDEGFRCETWGWSYGGRVVTQDRHEMETDCDGRHEHGELATCREDELVWDAEDFPPTPRWRYADLYQRDHTAEAAGY